MKKSSASHSSASVEQASNAPSAVFGICCIEFHVESIGPDCKASNDYLRTHECGRYDEARADDWGRKRGAWRRFALPRVDACCGLCLVLFLSQ